MSNDRGHLLAGVPRSKESPWGNFKGTWDDHMDFMNPAKEAKTKAQQFDGTKSINNHEVQTEKAITPREIDTPDMKETITNEQITE